MLFTLGSIVIDSPGPFNATDVAEEFGSDFAVKPVVGAMQDREFMGPADNHMTISGTLLPDFYARAGYATGLAEIEALRAITNTGESQILVRGDGMNLGYWLVEKVSTKSSRLTAVGVGREVTYDVSLVRTNRAPGSGSLQGTLTSILGGFTNLYG